MNVKKYIMFEEASQMFFKEIEGNFDVSKVYKNFNKKFIDTKELLIMSMVYRYLGKDIDVYWKHLTDSGYSRGKIIKKTLYNATSKLMHFNKIDEATLRLVLKNLEDITSAEFADEPTKDDWIRPFSNTQEVIDELLLFEPSDSKMQLLFEGMLLSVKIRMLVESTINPTPTYLMNEIFRGVRAPDHSLAHVDFKNFWNVNKFVINNSSHTFQSSFYKFVTLAKDRLRPMLKEAENIKAKI